MHLGKVLAAFGAIGLVATPLVAQAAQTDVQRTASPIDDSEELVGTGVLVLVGFLAALAAIVIIVSDEDEPASP